MGWIKPWLKNVVAGIGVIEAFARFFSFSDALHDLVTGNGILAALVLGAYAFYAYMIHDADLHVKRRKQNGRLQGAPRRRKKRK